MVKYNRFSDDSSSLRSRSRSRSRSSSFHDSSSSFLSRSDESDVYHRGVAMIERLLANHNKLATDESVLPLLQQFGDFLKLACDSDRKLLEDYLKRNACAGLKNVIPGTVGAQLCGCFGRAPRDGKMGCTAGCADSILFSGSECPDTIIHWAMTENGPASRVVKAGNSNCRVYIDPGFNATSEQKAEYLASLGCQTVSHYDSITNNSTNSSRPGASSSQSSSQSSTQPPKTDPVSNNPIGQTNQSAVASASDDSGSWVFWVVIVFVILIILAIIFYLYAC